MVQAVPEFRRFRKTVDAIGNVKNRTLIETLYLTAARVSEIVTKTSPWEIAHKQTKPFGNDLNFGMTKYWSHKKIDVLMIKVPLARSPRNSKQENFRVVALPCDLVFEPWSVDLLRYISENKRLSFDLTRQRVGQIVKKELRLLGSAVSPSKLRLYRIAHLVKEYGFDKIDLMAYLGLQMKTSRELAQLDISDTSQYSVWERYFPKLLKPFFQVP